jgi:hypothetical protein
MGVDTKSALDSLRDLENHLRGIGDRADQSEQSLNEMSEAAQEAAKVAEDAAKEQQKAAQKQQQAEEELADVMARNQGVRGRAAQEERQQARERVRLLREEARERAKIAQEADRLARQARRQQQTNDPQFQARSAFRELSVSRDQDLNRRIAHIEELKRRALLAEGLTQQERIRIEASANRQISRLRDQMNMDNLNGSNEAFRRLGIRRAQDIRNEINQVRERERQALAASNLTASERLRIERRTAAEIRRLNRQLADATASTFRQRMQAAANSVRTAGQSMTNIGQQATMKVSAPVIGGFGASVRQAAMFEQRMGGVRAIMQDLSDEDFQKLIDMAKEFGRTTQFSANEVAQGIEMLASNGLSAQQILGGALKGAITTTAATGGELSGAADLMTDVMMQFGVSAEEMTRVADQLTGLRSSSKLTFDDMRLAFGMGGGVAGMSGLSFEDYTAGLAATASMFTSGSDAGTSFKTFMLRMSSPDSAKARAEAGFNAFSVSDEVAAAMAEADAQIQRAKDLVEKTEEEYDAAAKRSRDKGGEANKTAKNKAKDRYDAAKEALEELVATQERLIEDARLNSSDEDGVLKSLPEIADELRRITAGKTQEQKTAMLGKIFGQDAIRTALSLAEMGSEGVIAAREKVGKGDSAAAAEIRMEGLMGELRKLASAMEGFAIALAESGLIQAITDIVVKLTEFVSSLAKASPFAMKMITWVGLLVAALGPLLLIIGQIAIGFSLLMTAISLISAPILLVVGIIAAIAAAIALLWVFKDDIVKILTGIGVFFTIKMKELFTSAFDWLTETSSRVWSSIVDAIKQAFASAIIWISEKIAALIDMIPTKEDFGKAWDGSTIGTIVNTVAGYANGVVNLQGPGTSTSDSIPAWLSKGETVHTAKATKFWGTGFMNAVQNMNPAAAMMPVASTGGGGRDLHPITLNIGGGAVDGVYGTPDAVRQLQNHQSQKSALRVVKKSRNFK